LSYLWILPGYLNLVWIYAFCNLHDVSWGTKGRPEKLPGVSHGWAGVVTDAEGIVTVPTPANDYEKHIKILSQPQANVIVSSAYPEEGLRTTRTIIVLLWIFSNAVLVATVFYVPGMHVLKATSNGGEGFTYVGVVLWSNVALLGIQYLGSLAYTIKTAIKRVFKR
jgi:chitin synthase